MYGLVPQVHLSKELILTHLSQEQIMERYCGVRVQIGKRFCSPLRHDRNPTCSFYVGRSGNLYLKDWSGAFHGDCFDVVRYLHPTVASFYGVLEVIAADFNLIESRSVSRKSWIEKKPVKEACIQIKQREWNEKDLQYWESFCINKATLKRYGVYACETVWLDDRIVYSYNAGDPAYAYRFEKGKYKIYYPKRKDYRFMCNTVVVQGWNQLPAEGEYLVITKALKDVMLLSRFGIPAIAFQSESVIPKPEIMGELQERFRYIYSLYDFDLAGIKGANRLKRRWSIKPLLFTNGRFGSPDYGAKDVSDMLLRWGKDRIKELIGCAKNQLLKTGRIDYVEPPALNPVERELLDVPF